MKRSSIITAYVVSIVVLSCRNPNNANHPREQNKTDAAIAQDSSQNLNGDLAEMTSDFMTWWKYTYYNIRLARDFIGLGVNSDTLDKRIFLNQLTTGKFIPLKIRITNNLPTYKLYKDNSSDISIKNSIIEMAQNEIRNYNKEGIELPNFNFIDLTGTSYNKSNTGGKIVVIKCWFINCVPCVKEFPQLNKLVDIYKNRGNLLFISLAMDSKEALLSFLKKKRIQICCNPW